jgi:tetratricopeptide (TPR) repeat protein
MKVRPRVILYSIVIACMILFLLNLPKLLEDNHTVVDETNKDRNAINSLIAKAKDSHKNKDYDKAIALYKKLINTFDEKFPEEYASMVKVYNNFAGVYLDNKEYEFAVDAYLKAYLLATVIKMEDENFGILLNNISNCYKLLNNYEEALKWAEKALPCYELHYGVEYEKTGVLKGNIKFLEASIK